ncbi:MAG: type II toxin-antitoxin system RelB/DinJ family antitoxin [Cardiobacteriaceae bacterium]|nr:type II toxin-antitoxin system RelB/DinJ family antitoxin [Cardiobacteriaceae bacterium]
MRLVLLQIAKNKSFPFDDIVPNQETLEAIKEVENNHLLSYGSVDELVNRGKKYDNSSNFRY